jgi:putative FmdB family regulatory protein
MPIYEFYCPACHAIFSFLSRRGQSERTPPCPRCGGDRMTREVSRFAVTGRASENGADDDLPVDEATLMRAMEGMEREFGGADENDPREAARMMKRFSELTGLEYGESMREAMRRLESGEDPDRIEEELGERIEHEEEPFGIPGLGKRALRRFRPPVRDDALYDMP